MTTWADHLVASRGSTQLEVSAYHADIPKRQRVVPRSKDPCSSQRRPSLSATSESSLLLDPWTLAITSDFTSSLVGLWDDATLTVLHNGLGARIIVILR